MLIGCTMTFNQLEKLECAKAAWPLLSLLCLYLLTQWQYCTSYCMIYFLNEVNCRFLSILLHKYLISIFFTSFIEEIIIWFYFLCLPAAKKVSFKISCSLSLLCWLQNLQVEWLFTSGGSLQANLKIFIFHRQITHQLHFFPTFTQLTSYIPHILLEITSFLLPIWSTFVYEASVLSLIKNDRDKFLLAVRATQ